MSKMDAELVRVEDIGVIMLRLVMLLQVTSIISIILTYFCVHKYEY